MAETNREAELATLREAVLRSIDETSLRHTARQVGMSPTGLHNFARGTGAPYGKTAERLRRWHRQRLAQEGKLAAEDGEAMLALLLAGLTGERRAAARARMLETIAEAHRAQGTPAPAWLEALRAAPAPER